MRLPTNIRRELQTVNATATSLSYHVRRQDDVVSRTTVVRPSSPVGSRSSASETADRTRLRRRRRRCCRGVI